MIRFVHCPKCGAQVENAPGVPCWSCGYFDTSKLPKATTDANQFNAINVENEYYTPVGSMNFKICTRCGAKCESVARECWECKFPFTDGDGALPYEAPKKQVTPNKDVPFGDIVYEPPASKKDQAGVLDKLTKPSKGPGEEKNGQLQEELEEERERKKEGKLILFHCPKCNEYYKVLFRKVREGLKCPACKNVKMKVSYYCTRCKTLIDFDTIERHVCEICKLDMILDPNFE
nr:hypothetical protein [Candidatus Sigynarchaeota archaeon]